ncbi:hypothetical protein FB565_000292 [Actinoplanes lutulentus]|nr:hypothetical protein [Actinoplanes lutulentus]MBB2940588.1 hypothetical protein [Actinoplanes lutulentus]
MGEGSGSVPVGVAVVTSAAAICCAAAQQVGEKQGLDQVFHVGSFVANV